MGQRGTRLTDSHREKLRASGKDIVVVPPAQNKLKFSGINTTHPENFAFDDYALQLATQEDWERYAATPADRIFAGTQVAKVVIATPSSKVKKYKAHFLHSQTYTYHYQFCTYAYSLLRQLYSFSKVLNLAFLRRCSCFTAISRIFNELRSEACDLSSIQNDPQVQRRSRSFQRRHVPETNSRLRPGHHSLL